ncbi:MAG TPA: hypothetical protein VIS76_01770 [Pseudomonadales bacterium]
MPTPDANLPDDDPAADRTAPALCRHFQPGPCPWETELVMDDHLGPTESLVACRTCGRAYLLEMFDWAASKRLFRVRSPSPEAVSMLMRDLDRGSCDLRRAGEEVRHFSLASDRLPVVLLYDTATATLMARVPLDHAADVPWTGWRDLPCDGTWITRLTASSSG